MPAASRPAAGWWALALLASLLALSGPSRAGQLYYTVRLDVPARFRGLLEQNLDIYRWRDNPLMNAGQLQRLYDRTPDQIRELIATEGFFSPEIHSSLEQGPEGPIARFDVSPGSPTHVGRVQVDVEGAFADGSGENAARLAKIRGQWSLPPGAVFRQADWEEAKRGALKNLLTDRYPAATIRSSRATVDPDTAEAALEVVIDSGPPFTFGELEISGLKRYAKSIVERLSTVQPGAPYSQAKLLDFQQRLQDTAYFSSALVSAEIDSAHPERVPVKVAVSEAPSQKIGFGIGMSTDTGARAQVDYRNVNFLDRAWRLAGALKLETKKQTLTGELQFPMTAAGYRDSLNAQAERTDIEGLVTKKAGLGAKRTRVAGKTETTLSLQYLAERQEVAGVASQINRVLAPNYSWTRRDVDNLLYPSRGYLVNAQIGGAAKAILSARSFLRGYGRLAYFLPLGDRDNLILRGEGGVVAAPGRDGIPSDYLFRTGGDRSVRGYAYQSLGVKEGNAVVGGRYLVVASAEYVHWLTPEWGAAAFFDAGDAADRLRDLKPAQGYGLGARWKSPVGLLEADLAYGKRTERLRLHFSVGFSF